MARRFKSLPLHVDYKPNPEVDELFAEWSVIKWQVSGDHIFIEYLEVEASQNDC